MNNLNSLFPNNTFFDRPSMSDNMEQIFTVNNMLISMLADPDVPDMVKPPIWGVVRKDTLSPEQFDSFLKNTTYASSWLRSSFPEMVKVTFINDDRKAKTPYNPKIAVYFEVKDDVIIVCPVGFYLPGGNLFKTGERADIDECRKLTDVFVFFGPNAPFASAMPREVLEALQSLWVNKWDFATPTMPLLNEAIASLHDEIEARIRYRAEANVLAPVLSLAVATLNDPAKRTDMGRWIRSEYLRDKRVFDHACTLLDIKVDTDGDNVVVTYL